MASLGLGFVLPMTNTLKLMAATGQLRCDSDDSEKKFARMFDLFHKEAP